MRYQIVANLHHYRIRVRRWWGWQWHRGWIAIGFGEGRFDISEFATLDEAVHHCKLLAHEHKVARDRATPFHLVIEGKF